MYWNNDYRHQVSKEAKEVTVHELASEAHIAGVVEYFGGNILIGGVAEAPDPLNYYQVKVTANRNAKYDVSHTSLKGYYNYDGVAGEFLALLALYFRARFYHVSTMHGTLTDTSIQGRYKNSILRVDPPAGIDDYVLRNNKQNLQDFKDFLGLIDSIPEEHHRAIISAASNYNLALREIGIDHEMVFIRLVSALEAFTDSFELRPKDDPFAHTDIKLLLKAVENDDIRKGLESSLNHRKSRLKFTRFLEKYSVGYFRGGNYKAKHTKIMRRDLEQLSKIVYEARSKYLHSGESMYLSQHYLGAKFDTDPTSGIYIGLRRFSRREKLPNIAFFEGLVRHCLLRKINEMGEDAS